MVFVCLRCHGLFAIARWTVAANDPRRAWILPVSAGQGISKADAPEFTLTIEQATTQLVARKPVSNQMLEQHSYCTAT